MEAWQLAASARTKQEAGDLDGAMRDIEAALGLDRRCAEALHVRAHVRRDRKQYGRAIRDFKRAARLAPSDYRNFFCRAVTRRLRGRWPWWNDWDGALRDLDRAASMCRAACVYNYRGYLLLELRRFDAAIAAYDEAVALDPNYFEPTHDRGLCRERQGDLTGAIDDYTSALAIRPESAHAYHSRGNARRMLGDVEQAIADWTDSLRIEPGNAQVAWKRGLAHLEIACLEEAERDFTRAITYDARHADAYWGRAQVREARGLWRDAARDLETAISVAAPSWEPRREVEAEIRAIGRNY